MDIFHFRKDVGKQVTSFNSDFIMSRITQTEKPAHIVCMHLEKNGVIGYHQAVVPQLFPVVNGEGFVRGNAGDMVKVHSGEAVFWEKGEWHETITETGLMAIVIESETLNTSSLRAVQK